MADKRDQSELGFTPAELASKIRQWGEALGFQQIGITGTDLSTDEKWLNRWLELERHGSMAYMAKHGTKRSRPQELVPETISIVAARLNYLSSENATTEKVLGDPTKGYISRYALGRDYHKVLRGKLKSLGKQIEEAIGPFGFRVFTDSAPVLERAIARNAGLGWIGKHSNLINRNDGSWFFLGEIYTDIELPYDTQYSENHCGSCVACIDVCPTDAIVAPYEVDARRCVSYLTIEYRDVIPEALRPLIGNRIFGCDDCQLVCPWNRFAKLSGVTDFAPRHGLDTPDLIDLFAWQENDFLSRTEGTAMRRINYDQWLRNVAIALGNAEPDPRIRNALAARLNTSSEMVKPHIEWALARQSM